MLFNSIEFAIFLPVVFTLYWYLTKTKRSQNILLLIASYFFYGCWSWKFLSLIIFSSLLDFFVGIRLSNKKLSTTRRRLLLSLSLILNLGFLAYFKYSNFFIQNFVEVFTLFGKKLDYANLEIILPVGISFYTFQTLSYTIDVYKNKLEPTSNPIAFFAFVSFFPQLVAGPIERASNLLPQFQKERNFSLEKAKDGLRQITWGLFKKVVIADNCAVIVNKIFENYSDYSGSTLLLGSFLFSLQIYGDFSGYSDIAIGTSRLFGFSLMRNFAFPYFSRDIAEFWRRWHISLSTWFRDYLYIPLGGSEGSSIKKVRNTFIVFLVSGFWHGANWTFVIWGLLNALYFLPLLLLNKNRRYLTDISTSRILPSLSEAFQIFFTFTIVSLTWVFFRAPNIMSAINYLNQIFSKTLFYQPINIPKSLVILILILISMEWVQKDKQHALDFSNKKIQKKIRWFIYYTLIIFIFLFGGDQQDFIYFQF